MYIEVAHKALALVSGLTTDKPGCESSQQTSLGVRANNGQEKIGKSFVDKICDGDIAHERPVVRRISYNFTLVVDLFMNGW